MRNNYDEINYEKIKWKTELKNDDIIAKLDVYRQSIKPRWWENIPLFCAITYSLRINNNFADVGGSRFDKNVSAKITKWLMSLLIVGFFVIELLTPWLSYYIIRSAIKQTKQEIYNLF